MNYICSVGIAGGGKRPETWGTVVVCLRQVGLEYIAESIEAKYGKAPGTELHVSDDSAINFTLKYSSANGSTYGTVAYTGSATYQLGPAVQSKGYQCSPQHT